MSDAALARDASSTGRALRAALLFLLFGLAWVLLSDRILRASVSDPLRLTRLETLKGWAFVLLSAGVIWALVRHAVRDVASDERHFRALVEQMLAGVGVVQEGRVVYANPRLARVVGMSVAELLSLEHPEDVVVEGQRPLAKELLSGASPPHRRGSTLRVRTPDGQERPVEVALQDTEWRGRPARIALVLDRSEETALEEQLRHAQRMDALGQLTGAVAHDFNNLLTAVSGPLELALMELDEGHPVREELTEGLTAVRSASRLTRQLLTFSRKRVSRPRPVELNETLRSLQGMLERLMPEGLAYAAELEDLGGSVVIDPAHLEQVLVNLVVNARDAMPGGGRLCIRTRRVSGSSGLLRRRDGLHPGDHAVLEVSDTGHGMDHDTRVRAFEPFFTTRERGTGLGLSTVFGIVRQAGGFIRVESESGSGTTMQVHLPLQDVRVSFPDGVSAPGVERGGPADRQGAGRSAAALLDGRWGAGRTILVAEDEDGVRRVFERVLGRAGFRVLSASDGAAALELADASEDPIDLLVTDMMLPGMSGLEVSEAFSRRRPGVPVLYSSGYSEEDLTRKLSTRPGLSYLEKPFQVDQLLDAVAAALNGDPA